MMTKREAEAAIHPSEEREDPIELRIIELMARGELTPAADPKAPVRTGETVPRGLDRFLADRSR